MRTPASDPPIAGLPRTVWVLGIISMLMDVSSEMIHGLLPLFLVVVLGSAVTTVGLIEGFAEATASLTKVLSGALSDRMGKRKPITLAGYTLSAVTKPLFALAASPVWVFAARFVDRLGKGIRGAPRDALIADLTDEGQRGAAFGLRQSLDTVGAVAGPLLAAAVMAVSNDDFRLVFWLAAVPAVLSAVLLAAAVHEPPHQAARPPDTRLPLTREAMNRLGRRFWAVIALAAALALGRYSEAFLLLRAEQLGLALAATPLVLVAMNVVYAASAYPAGRISDRIGRRLPIAAGCLVFVAANLVLAIADGPAVAFVGAALYGLHMGLTQGLLAGLVADTAPAEYRGTAFGVFHFVTGVALLPASFLAGVAWDQISAAAPFLISAALVSLAALGLIATTRSR